MEIIKWIAEHCWEIEEVIFVGVAVALLARVRT